jgi:hypothetical protein
MSARIFLMTGLDHMSEHRKRWIDDFLSLFWRSLHAQPGYSVDRICLSIESDSFQSFSAADLLVGHEIPGEYADRLSNAGLRYIDIRVSPVRFCAQDNLLALGSNDSYLRQAFMDYRVPDEEIYNEAQSLKLSFRYRDLGQSVIRDQATIFFTEQAVDQDSIHYRDPVVIDNYLPDLQLLRKRCEAAYYVHRGSHSDRDSTSSNRFRTLPREHLCSFSIGSSIKRGSYSRRSSRRMPVFRRRDDCSWEKYNPADD